jgi:hypothetical protein
MTGIDDHHKITTVGVGTEEGLVLPPEDGGDLTGEAADDLLGGWEEGREGGREAWVRERGGTLARDQAL